MTVTLLVSSLLLGGCISAEEGSSLREGLLLITIISGTPLSLSLSFELELEFEFEFEGNVVSEEEKAVAGEVEVSVMLLTLLVI